MRTILAGFVIGIVFVLIALTIRHQLKRAATAMIPESERITVPVIPRCDDLALNGTAEAWGQRGLELNLLQPNEETIPTLKGNFTVHTRLAWNGKALLARVEVNVPATVESKHDDSLWLGDSVEFFLGAGPDCLKLSQVTVSPGLDPNHPAKRDLLGRAPTADPKAFGFQTSAQKTPAGYAIEYTLPWSDFGVTPVAGQTCALQIIVHHWDGGAASEGGIFVTQQLYPYARGIPIESKSYFQLGDEPTPPINAMARVTVLSPQIARVFYSVAAEAKGHTLTVIYQDKIIDRFQAVDPGSSSKLVVLPAGDSGPVHLQVLDGRQVLADVSPDDFDKIIRGMADRMNYRMSATVFGQNVSTYLPPAPVKNEFPRGGMDQDALARTAFPALKVTTTYYDAKYNEVKVADEPGRYGAVVNIDFGNGVKTTKFFTLYRVPGVLNRAWRRTPMLLNAQQLGVNPALMNQPGIIDSINYALLDDEASDSLAVFLAGLYDMAHGVTSPTGWTNPRSLNEEWWYGLRQKLNLAETYPYLADLPEGYDADPNKRWPLILFLHGSGEAGDDLQKVRSNGLAKLAGSGKKIPAVLISPQMPQHEAWQHPILSQLIDDVSKKYRIDPDRIYVTGISVGGFATWDMAAAYPNRFAAVAPIAGGADPADAARFKNLPIWAFHGDIDDAVPVGQTVGIVTAIQKIGGTEAHMTLYPKVGHWSWDPAYETEAFYTWLFAQKRGQPEVKTPGLPAP